MNKNASKASSKPIKIASSPNNNKSYDIISVIKDMIKYYYIPNTEICTPDIIKDMAVYLTSQPKANVQWNMWIILGEETNNCIVNITAYGDLFTFTFEVKAETNK